MNVSRVFRIFLPHSREVEYQTFSANKTFVTSCSAGMELVEQFVCPFGQRVIHKCNGTSVGSLSTVCPDAKTVSACGDPRAGMVPSSVCRVESFNSSYTICVCRVTSSVTRRLSEGSQAYEDSGLIEVAAMSQFVSDEFIKTLLTSNDLTASSIQHVITSIVLFMSLWTLGVLSGWYNAWAAMRDSRKRKINALLHGTKMNAVAKNTNSPEMLKDYLVKYIDEIFPSVFRPLPWTERLVREITTHHRYLRAFWKTDNHKERFVITIQLLTIQTMLMFMLAVFYDVQVKSNALPPLLFIIYIYAPSYFG